MKRAVGIFIALTARLAAAHEDSEPLAALYCLSRIKKSQNLTDRDVAARRDRSELDDNNSLI
jgi:hypothetical protein